MDSDIKKQLAHLSKRIRDCELSVYAGQTAFFMILSFLPFLLFFFSLLKLTPFTEESFFMFASSLIPSSFQDIIYSISREIYNGNTGGRLWVTILTAVYLSSKSFWSIQKGLNSMYETRETRNQLLLRIYCVGYSIVFAVLLVAVLGIVVFGDWLINTILVKLSVTSVVLEVIVHFRSWICVLVLFLFFWIMYVLVPDRKSRWRHRWHKQIPGAVVAAMGWMLFSYAFSIYVNRYTNYASFYGTMTTIALVMLWLYGCMYLLFFGGLLNSILPDLQILWCSLRKRKKQIMIDNKGVKTVMLNLFGWKKYVKKDKELEEIILHLENNASNNYKDAAQKDFRQLKEQYAKMKESGVLGEKQIAYYENQIAMYEEQMKAFYHNPGVHR